MIFHIKREIIQLQNLLKYYKNESNARLDDVHRHTLGREYIL